MDIRKIYLAGPLFTLADRTHNLNLEKHLVKLGYEVILPQRRVSYFIQGEVLDLQAMAADCAQIARSSESILVANIDGTDADSGTAVEYGLAIATVGRAIVYRTDVRTCIEKEAGLNAMLTLEGTKRIYVPCMINTLEDSNRFYQDLASRIHRVISCL